MIEITIKKTTRKKVVETVNYITSKTPTDKTTKPSGYGDPQTAYAETYDTKEIEKNVDVTTTILNQQIENDEKFDLAAVIKAVNGL